MKTNRTLRRPGATAALGVALGVAALATASAGRAQDSTPPRANRAAAAGALRLDDVLSTALAQHPLLESARARVAAARGARSTAGVLPNPVLTYWTESTPFPGQRPSTPLDREAQTYATLPLEFLFQRRPQVRAADAEVGAASADLARARQTVALDAARAFFRVAQAQVAVDAEEDVRARLVDLLTYNQARVREGRMAEADQIRTQVELDRSDAMASLARAELARARAALAPYLGPAASGDAFVAAVGDTLRVVIDDVPRVGAMPPAGTPPTTGLAASTPLASLLATARAARPDVVAARSRVIAAQAQAGYQRALTVRQVGATFGAKRTLGVTSMIASFSVPLPVFDQNRGDVQRATALERAAEAELAWTERQAAAEVKAAHAAERALAEQAARLGGTMLARAEESRRIALAAYQEGAASLLQVLDASRTLADVRQTYYRLLFAQRVSRLELRAAIGDATLVGDAPSAPDASPSSSTTPRPARPTGDRP